MTEETICRQVEKYVESHREEAVELLMTLGRIPAPTGREGRRAQFCYNWLKAQGATHVTIDEAGNVLCFPGETSQEELVVFLAHMDVVFDDEEELPMRREGDILYAPGIGDDTGNLVNLLMATKYFLQEKPPLKSGILVAANVCEEGLGNLAGTRAIWKAYGHRIQKVYAFDLYLSQCISQAVGSYRYEISVDTQGGHSWSDFGKVNAIEVLAELIRRLAEIRLPVQARTTYNVGRIQGGTTVNAIASHGSILYEFRSISQKCLEYMKAEMEQVVTGMKGDYQITTTLLGVRPGSGEVDVQALVDFTRDNMEVIRTYYEGEIDTSPASTDANIPLSEGTIANTIGTVVGDGIHTRQEWLDLKGQTVGMKIILHLMMQYI